MNIIDIQTVKRINEDRGKYFFSPATMRFFSSRVAQCAYATDDNSRAYFVTSEQFTGSNGRSQPRRYTVRVMDMTTGDITEPHGHKDGFQEYASRNGAAREARRLAAL